MIARIFGMNYQTVTRIEKYVIDRQGSCVDLRHSNKGTKPKFGVGAKSVMLDQREL